MPFDVSARAGDVWDREILPVLQEFVAIPNVSEVFEPQWAELGHMDRAVTLLHDWVAARPVDGLTIEVHRLEGRAPVLFAEVPSSNGAPADGGPADDTVLLYGHLEGHVAGAGVEGGSISFMGMLGARFPEAHFLVTGVLGPGSNAHGPNEFLHVPTAKRLTEVIASVLLDHAQRT